MKQSHSFRSTVFAFSCILMLTACQSWNSQHHPYTVEYVSRQDQKIWFTEADVQHSYRFIASCIAANEMITDAPKATRLLAEYMQKCYDMTSSHGEDVDGGIRSLNLLKKIHQECKGPIKLWNDAVQLAKRPAPFVKSQNLLITIPENYF